VEPKGKDGGRGHAIPKGQVALSGHGIDLLSTHCNRNDESHRLKLYCLMYTFEVLNDRLRFAC